MHPETQFEWEDKMFRKILEYLRGELCVDLPYLERALSAFAPEGSQELQAFATEGIGLYFPPARYLKVFEENELFLRRAYLHTTLHCLYAHLWQMGERTEDRWNLACDIAVEYVIDNLDAPSTKRLLSWIRQQYYDRMKQMGVLSAAGIYELLGEETPERLGLLAREFYCDDHGLWGETKKQSPMPGQSDPKDAQQKWEQIARQVQQRKDKSDREEDAAAEMLKIEVANQKRRRSYREFLMKFSAWQEQLRCDPDEFDLNYYTYGLRTYGNLPLIEPLETKEEYRIREFVIAVDSSYSTSGELIRGFLQETLHILLEEHVYSAGAKVHLIQCDDRVQEDLIITSCAQAAQVLGQFEIKGGGSTDFRPAFTYVEELRKRGDLRHLGGMLYFTDGNGTYPEKKPDYPCAFLYLSDYDEKSVPPWAIRRNLGGKNKL